MQLRHVSTNLRQGLRRNLSMHAAVVLTLFISLSLAGIGIMLSQQATLTARAIGNELQIQVYLCVDNDTRYPQCASEVTAEQKALIEQEIKDSPEVESYYLESKETAFAKFKERYGSEYFDGPNPIVTAQNMPESFWITLKDPKEFQGVVSAVENLDGVREIRTAQEVVGVLFKFIDVLRWSAWGAAGVLVLAALLLVVNTIRLAALARRKEIEIMRLVGASRTFIALPFVLEALVTAALGVAMSAGAVAAFTYWGVERGVKQRLEFLPYVGWSEWGLSVIIIAIAGPLLTVLPTLLLTRKYLKY